MVSIRREWATPITAGVFFVMAATGLLMFFHLESGLNKLVHEWLGWLMVAAVAAHAAANWTAFRRYLVASKTTQALLVAAAVVIVGTSAVGTSEGPSPPLLAMRAMGKAPLRTLAALAGKSVAQVQAELGALGLVVQHGEQTLDEITGGDRRKFGGAVRALFPASLN